MIRAARGLVALTVLAAFGYLVGCGPAASSTGKDKMENKDKLDGKDKMGGKMDDKMGGKMDDKMEPKK